MKTPTQKPTDTRAKRPVVAWAHADGRIRWSRRYFVTLEPIAPELARSKHYKAEVLNWARLAYDNRTALVPGLPEHHGDEDAPDRYVALVREGVLHAEVKNPTRGFTLYDIDPAPLA